MNKTLVNNFQ